MLFNLLKTHAALRYKNLMNIAVDSELQELDAMFGIKTVGMQKLMTYFDSKKLLRTAMRSE